MSFWSATRCRHHVLLERPSDHAVLMIETPSGWELPVVDAAPGHPGDLHVIVTTMRERFGADVSPLGCAAHEFDRTSRVGDWIREVEGHGLGWAPSPPAAWVARGDLSRVSMVRPGHRALLTSWLASPRRPALPWEMRGWRDRAITWCQGQLDRRGFGRIERVDHVRTWEFSTVLRLGAGARQFFFKAVRHGYEREPRLTARLAERHPDAVADVVAFDEDERWMLMAGTDGPSLDRVSDLRRWEAAAAAYATLQVHWVDRVHDLLALGCADRRLARLAAEIAPCVAGTSALAPGLRRDFTVEELARLRALEPSLAAAWAVLDAYAIPATLEHADLWAANIIDAANGPVIIDWEDACLGHPFLALWHLLLSAEHRFDEAVSAAARIRDAYLEPWTRYESPKRLREAFDLAQRVAPLYFAITFRLDVLPILDASWELREFVPFFMRRLLDAWR